MKNNKIKGLMILFMIIQPLLDNYLLYTDEVIKAIGFSPTTIFRFALLGIIALYVFFKKDNKNGRIPVIIYGGLILGYTIIHHFVGLNIPDDKISSNYIYSLSEELFYLLRMIIPFVVAYVIYCLKPNKNDIHNVIRYSSLLVVIVLLGTNIFKIGKTSYFNEPIGGTIFDWLDNSIDKYLLASKGWFNSANQISGLVLVLLPMLLYYTLKNMKKFDLIIVCLLVLSSFGIGTRTACLGTILVLIAVFVLFIFNKYREKKKITLHEFIFMIIITIFSLSTFTFAPIVNCNGNNYICMINYDKLLNDVSNKNSHLVDIDYDGSYICQFMDKTGIDGKFYKKMYKCEENIEFWEKFAKEKRYSYIDNRIMETLILDDIYNKIDNSKINFFGMSRSRLLSAEFYLEKDIIVHYHTLGIIGLLLLIVPYFIPVIYTLLKHKFKTTLFDLCLILSICLPIVISIKTGHILDELIVTLYIGFILGVLLNDNRIEHK